MIEIRSVRTSDAESLVACFRRCYGGTYVAGVFNDAAKAAAEIDAGRLRSVVAVDPGEGVVAHMGLMPRPGARVAEMGNTVVDPRYRGQDLAVRLSSELARRCQELGLAGFLHYPTTAHPAMQKLAERGRGVVLGVLLDYIPAETRYLGFEAGDATARVAVVAAYHALGSAPSRHVWLPARHAELARSLHGQLGFAREARESREALPATHAQLTASFEERRGLLRIEVESLGADLADRIETAVHDHPEAPAIVDLPLCEPAVAAATEALAENGFFYGALLPEYVPEGDVLRLQRVSGEPLEPALETSAAKALFAYSLRDRLNRTPARPSRTAGRTPGRRQ